MVLTSKPWLREDVKGPQLDSQETHPNKDREISLFYSSSVL